MGVWANQIGQQFQSDIQDTDITLQSIILENLTNSSITFNLYIKDSLGNISYIAPYNDVIASNSGWNKGNILVPQGSVVVLAVSGLCSYYFSF